MKSSNGLLTGMICLCAIVLSSCGTGKKLEAANQQIESLQAEKSALQAENQAMKGKLDDVNKMANEAAQAFAVYKQECDAAKAKLAVGQAVITDRLEKLQAVNEKIGAALENLKEKGVEVFYRDGQVYISMGTSLLYQSGSAVLSKGGKEALKNVAAAVNEYPDLKMVVLGNTDDKLFKKGSDNWSLSTERANTVIRELVTDQVDPARLTAAGKGKFNPIADNSTEEGRAKNRRTEIILMPNLEKLWDSVQ